MSDAYLTEAEAVDTLCGSDVRLENALNEHVDAYGELIPGLLFGEIADLVRSPLFTDPERLRVGEVVGELWQKASPDMNDVARQLIAACFVENLEGGDDQASLTIVSAFPLELQHMWRGMKGIGTE